MVASRPGSHKSRELALRLGSALVLIPFALFVVATGGLILAIACAVFAATMGYEWARMTASPIMPTTAVLAAVAVFAAHFGDWSVAAITLLISAAIIAAVHPARINERAVAAFGVFYSAGLPLGLFFLREGEWYGQAAALILMGTVWASDTGAYFAGRGFGGPPLSPRDSPSKTWSGAIGAVVCSGLCGLIAAGLLDASRVAWLLAGVSISIVAQWGDLFESSLKRRYGVKDTSGFLPGHGGVMDRVDGLGMAAVFCAVLMALATGVHSTLGLTDGG
ncbi:phosphatidate cytidylyltransferase [Henriciella marina]|uniref:phosphatidate cytidylyltransferase n=1 Tax=Henriciella marina TaxID=453851 RepID=UPI000378ACDF|nr:phosphatidate cytidylyltransferase [Henriciella marina]